MDYNHGKYLAVDYGDVRTGLAECDLTGTLASGIGTIREGGMKKTALRVKTEAESRGCKKIVIGLPKNMDGTEGSRVDTVRAFAELLRGMTEIPIDFYDERMTTMVAYRYLGESETFGKARRNAVDTLSAEIILQDYLNAERTAQNKKG